MLLLLQARTHQQITKGQYIPSFVYKQRQWLGSRISLYKKGRPKRASPSLALSGKYTAVVDEIISGFINKQESRKPEKNDIMEEFQMPTNGDAPSSPGEGIPVFVMLPLDTINADGIFRYSSSKWFLSALQKVHDSGITGVAVDVWWGAVERDGPRKYDWSGYHQLFDMLRSLDLKVQIVLSFHACGGNVGDNAVIPLPPWVLEVGDRDPDIFFTDRPRDALRGQRNKECLSFFADEEQSLLLGRSPLLCYTEFMYAFREEFMTDLGDDSLIQEVVIGCGPCGELRYPSYPESNGWRFPGIGEFQCYDRRALASLARAAAAVGHPEWGNAGPHDAGSYNTVPDDTGFFNSWGGNWEQPYGQFFLHWYCNALLEHGERMLVAATSVFNTVQEPQKNMELQSLAPSSAIFYQEQQREKEEELQQLERRHKEMYIPDMYDAPLINGYNSQRQSMQVDTTTNNNNNNNNSSIPTSSSLGALPLVGEDLLVPSSPREQQIVVPQQQQMQQQLPPHPPRSSGSGTLPLAHPASHTSLRSFNSNTSLVDGSAGGGSGSGGMIDDFLGPIIPTGPPVDLVLKIAGVHWWYRTRSHAAELTAGYLNCETAALSNRVSSYDQIIALCGRYGASLTLTCVEMCDSQHPPEALCGPEGLLRQVREGCAAVGVPIAGENALPCFMPNMMDDVALQRVVYNTQPWGTPLEMQQQGRAGSAGGSKSPSPPTGTGNGGTIGGGMLPRRKSSRMLSASTGSLQRQSSSSLSSPTSRSSGPEDETKEENGQTITTSTTKTNRGGGASYTISNGRRLPPMKEFTFLRLTPQMATIEYQEKWERFVRLMQRNAHKYKSSEAWKEKMGFN
jgi:hypothetical protein